MKDDSSMETADAPTRRDVLRTTGAGAVGSVVGLSGLAALGGTASASSHYIWEENKKYEQTQTDGWDTRLATDSRLGYEGYHDASNEYKFELVTSAGAEYPEYRDGTSIPGVRKHEFTIDCCDAEFYPYIEENMTGTVPPETDNEVDDDLQDLAEISVEAAASLLKADSAILALEAVKETADLLTGDSTECSRNRSTYSVDRRVDGDIKSEEATTTQTEFGVEVPSDSSDGNIDIKCYTYADDYRMNPDVISWIEIWSVFHVWLSDGEARMNWTHSDYNKGSYYW